MIPKEVAAIQRLKEIREFDGKELERAKQRKTALSAVERTIWSQARNLADYLGNGTSDTSNTFYDWSDRTWYGVQAGPDGLEPYRAEYEEAEWPERRTLFPIPMEKFCQALSEAQECLIEDVRKKTPFSALREEEAVMVRELLDLARQFPEMVSIRDGRENEVYVDDFCATGQKPDIFVDTGDYYWLVRIREDGLEYEGFTTNDLPISPGKIRQLTSWLHDRKIQD